MAPADEPPRPEAVSGLKLDAMEVHVEPRAEWRQMFREACRSMREAFYDPGYHELDMDRLERRYEPYLDRLASRDDLCYLFAEMFGELCVSHIVVQRGDGPEVRRANHCQGDVLWTPASRRRPVRRLRRPRGRRRRTAHQHGEQDPQRRLFPQAH